MLTIPLVVCYNYRKLYTYAGDLDESL